MSETIATLASVFTADTRGFDSGASRVTSKLGALGKGMRDAGASMRSTGKRITAMTAPLAALGFLAVKTAIDWEDSFAGVRKTVDGTDEELAKLEQGLRDLASGRTGSPVAAMDDAHTQLAAIAEAAGQLGVKTEDILGFTEAIGMLVMSTNITAENGAMMAAQFANMTDLDLSDMDQFASVIVELGNNSATTENDILVLGQRIASAGNMAGLSWPSILAFSAAMMSLGLQPEAAGTAFSRFLNDMTVWTTMGMTDKLETISGVVGISGDNFAKLFQQKPDEALLLFFEKLGELPEAEQLTVLEDLGVDGARAIPVLLGLAANSSLLAEMLDLATGATGDQNAALEEARRRAETTQGQINELRNKFSDLMITIGERVLPILGDLIDLHLTPLIEKMQEWDDETWTVILGLAGLALALGPVTYMLGNVFTVVGWAITGLGLLWKVAGLVVGVLRIGLTPALGAVATPLGALVGLLIAGAYLGWPQFKSGIEKVIDSIQEGDLPGLLSGILESLTAIPLGIATWIGAQVGLDVPEGIKAWEGVLDNIKRIVNWLSTNTSALLGGIEFELPTSIKILRDTLLEIVGLAESIGGVFGIGGGPAITNSYNPGAGIDTRPTLQGLGGGSQTYGGHRNPGTFKGMATAESFMAGPRTMHERRQSVDMRGATVVLQGVQDPDEMLDQLQRAAGRRGMRLAWG